MKTYSAKSSVKRATIKALGLAEFEAGAIAQNEDGKFYFEPAAPVVVKKVVAIKPIKPVLAVVKTETKTVHVKHVKDLTEDRRKSDIKNPCKTVWDIAERMQKEGAKRKDIIAECEKQGIAFYTARTQYQKFTSAMKYWNKEQAALTE